MRVLALTPNLYGTSPGQRSSIELWQKVLGPAGIALDHSSFETERLRRVIYGSGRSGAKAAELARAYGRRLRSLRIVDDYDAVLVYREAALVGPELIERIVARRKPIIYQLDDPLYVPYRSPFSGWFSYLKFFGKVGRICRLSRVVIVNSSHHARLCRALQRGRAADTERRRRRPLPAGEAGNRNGRICIGWSGSASTVGNLQVIAEPVREVARRLDVRLHLVGVERPPFPGVETVALPWRAETEVDDLRALDVGLLPLPVNEWNKRKFFLKLVQYMALGIPAVATPLGSNPEVLEHGRTGFLADSPAEWVTRWSGSSTDAELRRQMGERSAEVAHRRYTVQANADRIVAAFRAAVS